MNHCLLEVEVIGAPTIRYTQNNQTPIAEMEVQFDGLRSDDAPGKIKVVGWGNLAQDLQNRIEIGHRLLVEGRLRMNTVSRNDGTKEKIAEFTLSRLHPLSSITTATSKNNAQNLPNKKESNNQTDSTAMQQKTTLDPSNEAMDWNTSPLVPDTDDIPF